MNDPIALFSEWFAVARKHPGEVDPTAMTLATATKKGVPSARVVLLKAFDARGFVFYTHLDSRKSQEIKENPYAALCFNWSWAARQVRIEGKVKQVSDREADEYFDTRPFSSRIGAIASKQSRPLDSRATLMKKVKALEEKYSETNPPPRPANWSGWRVVPSVMEFWQQGQFRLHDREVYTLSGKGWTVKRLYP